MSASKGIVIVGGTESDTHVVSLYLASIMLEESGYDVINRSCQNTVADLMAEPNGEGTVLAHVICNQNGHALDDLRELRGHKSTRVPVVLGGHYTLGCHNKHEQQTQLRAVGVDHFVETLEELIPLLEHVAALRAGEARLDSQRAPATPRRVADGLAVARQLALAREAL